ncbi:MAG: bifunctional precorrin-2 dehydrogenase/sirohydrochlorin ferrochelatase [Bacteroidetes bacterium]|nr:bifunctional precorrin-2 dehydrogenase/sirohydrochlorin ferrochelatase [Bacteroidota bacterium]
MEIEKNELFPIFLKAKELNFLIVGGGSVGFEKLFFLLKSSPDASVRLVASSISEEIRSHTVSFSNVQLLEEDFRNDHLEDMDLVIAATNSKDTNLAIRAAAKSGKLLANVADTPAYCDFYLGGIVTKGNLKIAISTNGKSPTFAKRFRQMLEEALPDSIPETLLNLRRIRDGLKGDFDHKVRKLNELTAVLTETE